MPRAKKPAQKRPSKPRTAKAQRAVVVTTEHRGIFFGYLVKDNGKTSVELRNARNCISWTANVQGFVGLSVSGPKDGCRVGPPAPTMTLYGITSVMGCSQEAVTAWENSKF